jgi:hypothetical protein
MIVSARRAKRYAHSRNSGWLRLIAVPLHRAAAALDRPGASWCSRSQKLNDRNVRGTCERYRSCPARLLITVLYRGLLKCARSYEVADPHGYREDDVG